jgi:hypothetical protein
VAATRGDGQEEPPPSRLFLIASYVVLVLGGVMLALFGSFLLPYSVSSATHAAASIGGTVNSGHVLAAGDGGGAGQLLSVGLLVVLIANPLLSLAGFWMVGTRAAAIAPLIGWLPIVLLLGSAQSAGSTVLSSNLRSSAFLLLGLISFLAVAVIGRPTRGAGAAAARPPSGDRPERVAGPAKPRAEAPASPTRIPSKADISRASGRRTAPKGGRRR